MTVKPTPAQVPFQETISFQVAEIPFTSSQAMKKKKKNKSPVEVVTPRTYQNTCVLFKVHFECK